MGGYNVEKDVDYEKEMKFMLSELKDKKDAMRFLYLFVKDVYNDERGRSSNREKGN